MLCQPETDNTICLNIKESNRTPKRKKQFKLQSNCLLPSVPVTGLLWHLRMVTSSLPFLFIENKIYKVIHTFFSFFVFFVCLFFTDFENWEYSKYTFFYPTSFFHYLHIYTRKNVRVFFHCIKNLCWLISLYGCSMGWLHHFWNDSPRHRLK